MSETVPPPSIDLIVLPAYNEAEAIGGTLAELERHLDPQRYEILVVNDGSKDNTAQVLEQLPLGTIKRTVLNLSFNCGIGVAIQSGYRFALQEGRFRYVIQFDGDGQHPAEKIPDLIDKCEQNNLGFVYWLTVSQ